MCDEEVVKKHKTFAWAVYILYAISFLVGFLPMIAGLILAYVSRSSLKGACPNHYLETHYNLQIRVFWYTLLLAVFTVVVVITFMLILPVGIIVAIIIAIALFVWLIYRIVYGMVNLNIEKPV